MDGVLLIHLACTWFMTGLIWFVQVVHYPLFADVGSDNFETYERSHIRKTTWVVAPVMLLELATGIWLMAGSTELTTILWALANLSLLLFIWLITCIILVPVHRRLECGFDRKNHHQLVRWNWSRTILWTIRAAILVMHPSIQ